MRRAFKLFGLLAIIVLALGATGAAFAAPPEKQDVCPEDGGWSDHQDPPFHSVADAVEYCGKGGSSESEGCTGYFVIGSYDEVLAAINADGACGLSHWGYRLGEPTNTPEPTDTPTPTLTPTPTETPTEGPSPTPTNTPETQPSPTPPPTPHHEPKTGPEDALPIAGIVSLFALLGLAGASLRIATKPS